MSKSSYCLEIYSDGGANQKHTKYPDIGGTGTALRLVNNYTKEYTNLIAMQFTTHPTTNNQMELFAAIMGLQIANELLDTEEYEITDILWATDSQYTLKGITDWIKNWKKNKWRTSDRKPVKNKPLWVYFDKLYTGITTEQRQKIVHKWVKGHNGHEMNEFCDKLANLAYINERWEGKADLKSVQRIAERFNFTNPVLGFMTLNLRDFPTAFNTAESMEDFVQSLVEQVA